MRYGADASRAIGGTRRIPRAQDAERADHHHGKIASEIRISMRVNPRSPVIMVVMLTRPVAAFRIDVCRGPGWFCTARYHPGSQAQGWNVTHQLDPPRDP